MSVIEIIKLYNPKVSLDKESIFMIPVDYMNEIRELAKMYNAKLEIYQKRRGRYVYIKWTPATITNEEESEDEPDEQYEEEEDTQ